MKDVIITLLLHCWNCVFNATISKLKQLLLQFESEGCTLNCFVLFLLFPSSGGSKTCLRPYIYKKNQLYLEEDFSENINVGLQL